MMNSEIELKGEWELLDKCLGCLKKTFTYLSFRDFYAIFKSIMINFDLFRAQENSVIYNQRVKIYFESEMVLELIKELST